jgi:hypothetical protein
MGVVALMEVNAVDRSVVPRITLAAYDPLPPSRNG